MQSKEILTAPIADAITPSGVVDSPSACGALIFTAMKMIEDLGHQYATPTSKQPQHNAIFECPFCKSHFKASIINVKRGNTMSCGCYQRKRAGDSHRIHELREFKDFKVWQNIKERTCNPKNPKYKFYGGKGIRLCDEWFNDVEAFISYIYKLPHHREEGYTIDRIDSEGNYEPGNLRYATRHIQGTNTKMRRTNTSGYTGICFSPNTLNHWQAGICVNKKEIYLGCHRTPKEAAIARNNYIIANNLTEYKLNDIK